MRIEHHQRRLEIEMVYMIMGVRAHETQFPKTRMCFVQRMKRRGTYRGIAEAAAFLLKDSVKSKPERSLPWLHVAVDAGLGTGAIVEVVTVALWVTVVI